MLRHRSKPMIDDGHSTTSEPATRPALVAGLIGGTAFLAVWMALAAIGDGNPWGPLSRISTMLLGEDALEAKVSPRVVIVALLVHGALSTAYAVLLAVLIERLSATPPVVLGILFGLLLYAMNFHFFTAWFDSFVAARGTVVVFGHVTFGIMTAVAYESFRGEPEDEPRTVPPR